MAVLSTSGCKSRKAANPPDDSLRLLSGRPWHVAAKATAGSNGVESNLDGDTLYVEGDRHLLLDDAGKVVDQGGFETPGGKRTRFRTPQGTIDVQVVELSKDHAVLRGTMTSVGAGLPIEITLSPQSGPFHLPIPSTLHEAATLGDVPAIRRLLAAGAKIDEILDGASPLMLAAYHCHPSAVEALLQAGGRTDLASGSGKSALIVAVESGDVDVVRALLAKKADVGFRRASDKASPLVIAVESGDLGLVRVLAEAGARLQDQDEIGNPLLCIAAAGDVLTQREFPDLVKFLLDKKLDPNQRGRDGVPALFKAALGDFPETFRLLLDRGADPKATDAQGRPLAEYAANSPAVLKALAARR